LKANSFPSFSEPPAILEAPKNLEISVNRTARFDCKASSGSKITWFKQVQGSSSPTSILKLGRRFNVFPNGSLKIHPVQKVDEAFYRCRAENFIGYNHARAFLRVLGTYGFILNSDFSKFSKTLFGRVHLFPRLTLVYVFPRLVQVVCFPALDAGCIFSRAWHHLHAFPH